MRQVLAADLGCTEVLEAGSLPDALALVPQAHPLDLIIVDLNMPGVENAGSIGAMCDAAPEAKVVVLSASEARFNMIEALSAGIDGYVPKSLPASEIIAALRQILNDSIYVPRLARHEAEEEGMRRLRCGVGLSSLTDRQREVLGQLMLGKSSKEIGRALKLAEATVKIHLAAIYRVLGVRSRGAAIAKVSAAAR
jgi:DNA-binding NarL/FixJ family response regulator